MRDQATDRRSPEALVRAMYELISGPAEHERDWESFRRLFHPGARFLIYPSRDIGLEEEAGADRDDAPGHGEWDVEGFIEVAAEEYRSGGFWEREVASRTERFGNVAHVFSTYESRVGSPASEPVGRGINSVQCVRTGDGWCIAHLVFDVEADSNPIPVRYLRRPEDDETPLLERRVVRAAMVVYCLVATLVLLGLLFPPNFWRF